MLTVSYLTCCLISSLHFPNQQLTYNCIFKPDQSMLQFKVAPYLRPPLHPCTYSRPPWVPVRPSCKGERTISNKTVAPLATPLTLLLATLTLLTPTHVSAMNQSPWPTLLMISTSGVCPRLLLEPTIPLCTKWTCLQSSPLEEIKNKLCGI